MSMKWKGMVRKSIALFLMTVLLVSQPAVPVFAEDVEADRQAEQEGIALSVVADGEEEEVAIEVPTGLNKEESTDRESEGTVSPEDDVVQDTETEVMEEAEAHTVVYEPQPATMEEVQAAISSYNQAYQAALASEGLLTAVNVAKPHWEYEVASNLMPSGWHCELVAWDTDFGADYYTFFLSPVALSAAEAQVYADGTATPVLTSDLLTAAAYVNSNKTTAYTIYITEDITLTTAISITNTAGVTIQSDAAELYTLTQSNANIRHFSVDGKLTLQNIILDGGSIGGGVAVRANRTFIMNAGTVIQKCRPTSDVAAVYVNGGNFDMYGGEIRSNACHGVFVMYSGNFNMYGGIIGGYNSGDGNTATNWGGGVGVYYGSNFTLYEGEIVGNTAEGGGGVFMYQNYTPYQNNTFTMKGGLIHGNRGTAPYYSYGGGGILMWGGTFIMEGGAITNNAAHAGGGIQSVFASAEIYIYDGEINGNTADLYGGGICAKGKLELGDLTGAQEGTPKVNGNTTRYGGGVFVDASSFTMGKSSGSATVTPVIMGNTAYHSGGGVYVTGGSFDMHDGTIGGVAAGNEASIGGGVYTFRSSFNMYGGELISNAATNAYTSLLPTPPGNPGLGGGIYLSSSQLYIHNGKINGNAATLAGGGIYGTFGVSNSNGTTTFQYSNINLYDGEINGNTAGSNGGGVYIAGGTFRMENGEISNNGGDVTINDSSYGPVANGGGVYTPHGEFEMCDGSITDNIATNNGGGVCTGIQIVDLTSSNGGRYVFAGNFSMGDPSGTITAGTPILDGNISGGNGGGIYISETEDNATKHSGTFVTAAGITCTLTNNSAVGDGGGIYTEDTTYVNLTTNSNTIFSDNTAYCYYADAVASSYPNVQSAGVSVPGTFALNNYDINYTGHFTATYGANGAASETAPVDNTNYLLGTTVTVAGPGDLNRPGYTFAGWNTAADGSGQTYLEGSTFTITGNVTLYAIWENNVYALSVLASTGGDVDTAVNGGYGAGTVITITATPNSGYTFSGWTSSVADGTFGSAASASTTFTMPAANTTVTAAFTLTDDSGGDGDDGDSGGSNDGGDSGGGNDSGGSGDSGGGSGDSGGGTVTYAVTYNANGGTGSNKISSLSSGTKHKVLTSTAIEISYDGCTFIRWNTKADGSGTAYAPNDSITVTGNVTLYAQWKKGDVQRSLETEAHIPYLSGYPGGFVKPDAAISRAETASIFYQILTNQGAVAGKPFSDVDISEWYAQAVNYLASIGVLSGYPDGTFRPNAPATRAEFAAMAAYFDSLTSTEGNAFSDVPSVHWGAGYINSAHAKGWISGYPDGTFRPENKITRVEVVTIVNAMLDRKIDDTALAANTNPYSDIDSSHWGYADIIEASITHEYIRDESQNEIWSFLMHA